MSLHPKRHRAQSHTPTSSPPSSPEAHPPHKASRTAQPLQSARDHPLLCTLPPTCTRRPTPLATTKDLEAHYAMYHAHVCEQPACGAVFPDARLLELHQTECHDPLAAVRKDRGEKIFACHLTACAKLFLTPKARRLHLIQAHGYPKEFFFAVTNKGVGGLLTRWGEGASLIRGEWTARDNDDDATMNGNNADSDGERDAPGPVSDSDSSDTPVAANPKPRVHPHSDDPTPRDGRGGKDEDADDLARAMGSLTLVPPSIRFGRGGKAGGFVHRGGGAGRGRGRRASHSDKGANGPPAEMDIDPAPRRSPPPHLVAKRGGLGWAGRGRAGIAHVPGRGRGRGRGRGVDDEATLNA